MAGQAYRDWEPQREFFDLGEYQGGYAGADPRPPVPSPYGYY